MTRKALHQKLYQMYVITNPGEAGVYVECKHSLECKECKTAWVEVGTVVYELLVELEEGFTDINEMYEKKGDDII